MNNEEKSSLTKQERKILSLHSVGLSAKEIADKLGLSVHTVQKHITNIKKKTEWSKAAELSGFGICEFLGLDYSEVRRRILSSILLIVFCLNIALSNFSDSDTDMIRRSRRQRSRRQEYEMEA